MACQRELFAKLSRWHEEVKLVAHLRRHGCYLKREGAAHSLWINPQTGQMEAIPRHTEIPDQLKDMQGVDDSGDLIMPFGVLPDVLLALLAK